MRGDRADTQRRLLLVRELLAETPLPLAQAAEAAYLSPFHFHRVFAATFGETPHQFVAARKLERARRLLLESDFSVAEIGYVVGFEGPAAFATAFRRQLGMTPTEFRLGSRRYYALTGLRTHRFIPACFTSAWKSQD